MIGELWNMMNMRQKKQTQDVIRYGLLWGGVLAAGYNALHPSGNPVMAVAAIIWINIWWAVQLFYKKRDKN